MPSYGAESREARDSCHPFIISVLNELIVETDIKIICGHRNEELQQEYFRTGRSKVEFPNSEHNIFPSMAIDFAPWPIDWGDKGTRSQREKARARFYYVAGQIKGITDRHNSDRLAGASIFVVRFGLDWDGDMIFTDQTFDDLGHAEFKKVPMGAVRNG